MKEDEHKLIARLIVLTHEQKIEWVKTDGDDAGYVATISETDGQSRDFACDLALRYKLPAFNSWGGFWLEYNGWCLCEDSRILKPLHQVIIRNEESTRTSRRAMRINTLSKRIKDL